MKSKFEVEAELKRIREMLAEVRLRHGDDDMLYGAQQALGWALDELESMSNLHAILPSIMS